MIRNITRTDAGFSLVQVLIALMLTGILSAIAIPTVTGMASRVVTQTMRADALATKAAAESQIRWDGVVISENVKVVQTDDNITTFEATGVFDYTITVRNAAGSPSCVRLTSASTEGMTC